MKFSGLFIISMFVFFDLEGQLFQPFNIEFITNNKNLAYPLAGGLNCPQLSAVDLNNDGLDDLHVFDRIGDVHLTFLNDGTKYNYAPQYQQYFPKIQNWVLLRDYNGDGIQDIFAYGDVIGVDGIMVFTGYYQNGHISFKRYNFPKAGNWNYNIISFLLSNGTRTQLYVSRIDYPTIDDMDCDGDLDILTFNVAGGFVELYTNRSVERGYARDSLMFNLAEDCWGGFFESGFYKAIDLSQNPGGCVLNLKNDEISLRHAGSTLLTFDADNDGDKDLILGDLSFNNLNFLTNAGDCQNAWINKQDTIFPNYNVPLDLPIFPASFYIDLNHDTKKDLAVAPNAALISEDLNVLWRYENTGTNAQPKFTLRQKDFLVGEMLDFGTNAQPTFFDYNADGLLDLVIGNYSFYKPNGENDARLFLFKNVGTISKPKYQLENDNYLSMSVFSQNTYHFAPTFGDLDGDGDQDALVGEEQGRLFYAENTAGAGKPAVFGAWQYDYKSIDVGIASTPFIADVNGDGLADLLIGERNGNINYFQNVGSKGNPQFIANPATAPNTDRFGRVDTRVPGYVSGYSAPVLIKANGRFKLLTGTEVGQIELYDYVENKIYDTLMMETEQFGGVNVGFQTKVALADIDNDGFFEMLVGNQRGGLSAFKTNLVNDQTVGTSQTSPKINFQIVPNPAADQFQIITNGVANKQKYLKLFNASGQLLLQKQWTDSNLVIDIRDLPTGVYFAQIGFATHVDIQKIVIAR